VSRPVRLGELQPGQGGTITQIEGSEARGSVARRLMEMGFLEGAHAEIVHVAPFGADPIAVRVRGTLVALRRQEASLVVVAFEGARHE
jgi:ferrous iron transport protein A